MRPGNPFKMLWLLLLVSACWACTGSKDAPSRLTSVPEEAPAEEPLLEPNGAELEDSLAVPRALAKQEVPARQDSFADLDLEKIRQRLGEKEEDPSSRRRVKTESSVRSLSYYLDRVWGVRLPDAGEGPGLEAAIGRPPYELQVPDGMGLEHGQAVPAELLVVVEKRDLLVNQLKVADILNVAPPGAPEDYQITREEGRTGIWALIAQTRELLRARGAVLRGVGIPEILVQSCDSATILMDASLPYHILAEVIQSLGLSGLYRFRLAARDPLGLVTYLKVSSPRMVPEEAESLHLYGDDWWDSLARVRADFEYAYLSYLPARYPDDWEGELRDVPVCVPPALRAGGEGLPLEAAGQIRKHLNGVRDLDTRKERSAGEVAAAARLTVPESSVGAPPLESLAFFRRAPFVYLDGEVLTLVLRDLTNGRIQSIFEFAGDDLEGLTSTLLRVHPERAVLHLGAAPTVTLQDLTTVASVLRRRCELKGMGGQCSSFQPWLDTIYLFTAPEDGFAALASASTVQGQDPKPQARLCPARPIEALIPELQGRLGECKLEHRDLEIRARWQVDGSVEVVEVIPTLSADRLDCIRQLLPRKLGARNRSCEAVIRVQMAVEPAKSTPEAPDA